MAIDAALFHLYLYYDHGRYIKALGDKTLFANPHYSAIAHAMGGRGRPGSRSLNA